MKALSIILIVVFGFIGLYAEEAVINLDRVNLLEPSPNEVEQLSNRIAAHFAFPERAENTKIIYAELVVPFDLSQVNREGSNMLEIQARYITSDWNQEDPDCFDSIDESTVFTYTIDMARDSILVIDVTGFVQMLAEDSIDNYGLMLIPYKYDQSVVNLTSEVASAIRESGQIRIIYK